MSDENFWPEDFLNCTMRTPASILREQANHLVAMTRGLLQGNVDQIQVPGSDHFVYDFAIIAPALGGYRYTLLRITHSVQLYPVKIQPSQSVPVMVANDEKQFAEKIRLLLNNSNTKQVLAALLSQSR